MEDRTPSCYKYKSISNRQLKRGFFYCEFKQENMYINSCKGCEHKDELFKDMFKSYKTKGVDKNANKTI